MVTFTNNFSLSLFEMTVANFGWFSTHKGVFVLGLVLEGDGYFTIYKRGGGGPSLLNLPWKIKQLQIRQYDFHSNSLSC